MGSSFFFFYSIFLIHTVIIQHLSCRTATKLPKRLQQKSAGARFSLALRREVRFEKNNANSFSKFICCFKRFIIITAPHSIRRTDSGKKFISFSYFTKSLLTICSLIFSYTPEPRLTIAKTAKAAAATQNHGTVHQSLV